MLCSSQRYLRRPRIADHHRGLRIRCGRDSRTPRGMPDALRPRLYRAPRSVNAPGTAVAGRRLSPARGRLLVVGLGPGHDLSHIPVGVTQVVAVERARLCAHSLRRIERTPVPVWLLGTVAERYLFRMPAWMPPWWRWCLLRAGPDRRGVRAAAGSAPGRHLARPRTRPRLAGQSTARWQDRVDPLWRLAACCHLTADTRRCAGSTRCASPSNAFQRWLRHLIGTPGAKTN